MFSIIDNEIKVKIEILGGVKPPPKNPKGGPGGTGGPAPGSGGPSVSTVGSTGGPIASSIPITNLESYGGNQGYLSNMTEQEKKETLQYVNEYGLLGTFIKENNELAKDPAKTKEMFESINEPVPENIENIFEDFKVFNKNKHTPVEMSDFLQSNKDVIMSSNDLLTSFSTLSVGQQETQKKQFDLANYYDVQKNNNKYLQIVFDYMEQELIKFDTGLYTTLAGKTGNLDSKDKLQKSFNDTVKKYGLVLITDEDVEQFKNLVDQTMEGLKTSKDDILDDFEDQFIDTLVDAMADDDQSGGGESQIGGGEMENIKKFNDALIKDIKLELIGGSSITPPTSGLPTKVLKKFLLSLITDPTTPADAKVAARKAYYDIRNGTTKMDYKDLELINQSNKFTESIKNVNDKLVINISGKNITLGDYWAESKEPINSTNVTDLQNYFRCFAQRDEFKLLLDDNDEIIDTECFDLLKNPSLWKSTADDIKEIHPKVAINILNALAIGGEEDVNTGLTKVKSYDDWWSNLSDKAKNKYRNGSTRFQNAEFIKLLIEFVNANPKLINSDDIPDNEKDIYGVEPSRFNKKIKMELGQFQHDITSKYNLFLSRLAMLTRDYDLFSALPLSGFRLQPIQGGNISSFIFPSSNYNKKLENFPRFSVQLRKAFVNLKSKLKSYRKVLSKNSSDIIESIFVNLENHEKEAMEAIKLVESYYLNASLNNDKASRSVEWDELKEAKNSIKKHFIKMNKRAINILDIAGTYYNAIVDQRVVPLSILTP